MIDMPVVLRPLEKSKAEKDRVDLADEMMMAIVKLKGMPLGPRLRELVRARQAEFKRKAMLIEADHHESIKVGFYLSGNRIHATLPVGPDYIPPWDRTPYNLARRAMEDYLNENDITTTIQNKRKG